MLKFAPASGGGGGCYSHKFPIGVCREKSLKSWPYSVTSKDESNKIDPLFKAQTRNVGWRSKQRLTAMENHNLYKIAFNRSFVFRWTGCLRTAILADII